MRPACSRVGTSRRARGGAGRGLGDLTRDGRFAAVTNYRDSAGPARGRPFARSARRRIPRRRRIGAGVTLEHVAEGRPSLQWVQPARDGRRNLGGRIEPRARRHLPRTRDIRVEQPSAGHAVAQGGVREGGCWSGSSPSPASALRICSPSSRLMIPRPSRRFTGARPEVEIPGVTPSRPMRSTPTMETTSGARALALVTVHSRGCPWNAGVNRLSCLSRALPGVFVERSFDARGAIAGDMAFDYLDGSPHRARAG